LEATGPTSLPPWADFYFGVDRLEIGAAAFALFAAIFWFLSAYGKMPPMLNYWDFTPDTDPFYQAVRFSAEMNTSAAASSSCSTCRFLV
jgi:hypothetical protein